MISRFIVTELCSGTLENYVNSKNDEISLKEWEILYQITKGLEHLHNLGMVHRDIKPTNILVSHKMMKLANFGLSKVLQTDKEDFTNTNVGHPNGTRGWLAPWEEVYECNRFDFKVNI